MKAFVLNTYAVDTIRWGIIAEPADRASYPIYACLYDKGGNLVTNQYYSYQGWVFSPPVVINTLDVSSVLNVGEYELTIENDISCRRAQILGKWDIYIDNYALYIFLDTDKPARGFSLMVYNGKLYTYYGDRMAIVKSGSTAFVEVVDSDGNGFVDLRTWTTGGTVSPNVKVPFMTSFDIEFSGDVHSIMSMINIPGHKTAYEIIGSNKLRVYILKDGPGLPVVAVIAIAAMVVAGIFAVGYTINAIGNLVVKTSASQMLNDIRNAFNTATLNLQNELAQCTDEQCRAGAYSRYITTIDSLSSLLGQVSVMTEEQRQRCDGVKIGDTCIPWWMVAIGALLVILLLR